VELDAVYEIRIERGPQDVAHVGMVVPQTGEALAGMEVEIGAPGGVVQIRPLRRRVLLVEAEDPQYLDQRWVEMARRQLRVSWARAVASVTTPRGSAAFMTTVADLRWNL